MKPYAFILALGLFSTAAYAGTPWETYLSLPTPENASKVTALQYSAKALPPNYGYWAPDLEIMKNQILGGDGESFRLAYRLLEKADGGLLEDLMAILGKSIRVQPELFLREMAVLKPKPNRLKGILMVPGLEYTDRPKAKRYEIEMRRKALMSVTDENMKAQQEQCLSLMQN
jgi:hypothetical protein